MGLWTNLDILKVLEGRAIRFGLSLGSESSVCGYFMHKSKGRGEEQRGDERSEAAQASGAVEYNKGGMDHKEDLSDAGIIGGDRC